MSRTILFLFALACYACKKDCPEEPVSQTLSGRWQGKYSHMQVRAPGDTVYPTPNFTYTMIFSANGTMLVYDGDEGAQLMATGKYGLYGQDFYAEYSYIRGGGGDFSISARLEKPDSIAGFWHIGQWGVRGGKFYLLKK
ncbi:hypothetical protein ACWKWU_11545 [Chitinophaga lutea]